jgi:hypothetical protein
MHVPKVTRMRCLRRLYHENHVVPISFAMPARSTRSAIRLTSKQFGKVEHTEVGTLHVL